MPALTMASMLGAWCWLPSHFITSAPPSDTNRPAFSTACAAEMWKLQYGMSTIRMPYCEPRATALVMLMTSSKVTDVVVGWPNRIMPPVSETQRMSMPPSRSAITADR